jgi:hypothetical protein
MLSARRGSNASALATCPATIVTLRAADAHLARRRERSMKSAALCAFLIACASSPSSPSGNDDSATDTGDTAVIPTIDDVSIANPYDPANTMMFAVTVTVSNRGKDAAHDATVGFAPHGTDCESGVWNWGPSQRFDTKDALTWILYNFEPGEPYDYKVQLGTETKCGELGTPALPPTLAAIGLTFTKGDYQTKYVVFDTDDCSSTDKASAAQRYLIAVDPATEHIVWYLDVAANSSLGGDELTGWRYQSDRFLATVDKRYFYEWAWDGSVISAKDVEGDACDGTGDGPCIHHDAFRSDVTGNTYVITSEQSSVDGVGTSWDVCGTGSRFLNDGFQVLDDNLDTVDTHFLMSDYGYDPAQNGGPNVIGEEPKSACDASLWAGYFQPYETIDWTHMNSVAASTVDGAEVLDLSVKEWDQILRVDETGKLLWRLSPHAEYSDYGLRISPAVSGSEAFAGQHDVHAVAPDTLMMFDNAGDSTGSRALRVTLSKDMASIERSWVVVDGTGTPLVCRTEGSAEIVPDTDGEHVLVMCNDGFTVAEIADGSGVAAVPPLAVSLPEKGYCTKGGPENRVGMRGWYRAFPVDQIGDF